MIRFVRFASLIAVLAARPLFSQQDRQFTSQRCYASFSYPGEWEVIADTTDRGEPCNFKLRPRNWRQRLAANDSMDVFTVHISIFNRDVWALARGSGFERRSSGWVVLGREAFATRADSVTTPHWSGVRGTAQAGCYREGGAYAGLCDNPTAVVGAGRRSARIVAGPRAEGEFNRVLATLRFGS